MLRIALTMAATLVGYGALAGSASAAAPEPAWAVQSIASPTSFSSTDTHKKIIQLSVVATGGTFQLEFEHELSAVLPWDATAGELQAAIDSFPGIGGVGASATVIAEPAEPGAHSYQIAIGGGALVGRNDLIFEPKGELLTGPAHKATIKGLQEALAVDRFTIVPTNVGARATSSQTTVTDTLPSGVTVLAAEGLENFMQWSCETGTVAGHETVTCITSSAMPALASAGAIVVHVAVPTGTAGPLENRVRVSGGGATLAADAQTETPIDAPPTAFGLLEGSTVSLLNGAGAADSVAGDHPDAQFTAFAFPTTYSVPAWRRDGAKAAAVENVKQIVVDLPPGVVGDALAAPTCSLSEVASLIANPEACPAASHIGNLTLLKEFEGVEQPFPIFNVQPERGYPAEFAVYEPNLKRAELLFAHVVGTGADTHVRVVSGPQSYLGEEVGISAVFFGHPPALDGALPERAAFFTNPSDCTASGFVSTIHVDSWQHPGRIAPDGEPDFSDPNWKSASSLSAPVAGCEALQFHATLSAQPTNTAPDAPTGLNVDLHVTQNEDPNGLATPPLKDATVTLPRGVVISPSAANGLQACSDEQLASSTNDPVTCPQASQIGTVTLHTPILAEALEGQVFLGTPQCSPCGNADAQSGRLARLFIQIHSDQYGITLKIPGNVLVDPSTGQLTASFKNNPQQPFSGLEMKFPQSDHATLATPNSCASYTATSDLVPWSSPQTPDATPSSSFSIGCGGNAFSPSFTAGTTSPGAGSYSPFTLTFSRNDTEQDFSGLEQTLPQGLLARLAGVPQCASAEANAGQCPAGSRIGTVTVGTGPGGHPFFTTGSAYLTGPYNGGPFGVAVIVQAVAGPFNLGTVVVRNSIRIDPTTAQATVVSDQFPNMLAGIPLQIRTVNVTLDRPEFTFNPTNCSAMAVTGKLVSTQGTSAPVSSRFQSANCASLPFKPSFTVATAGHSSKAGGASLDVKVASRGGPQAGGGEANIRSVKVDLPIQLPSRLTTLQKACLANVFEANPAACPKESNVGTATAKTRVLANPLSGPAYLVSHGGAAFPDLEIVLQGEGIVLVLDGQTNIKKGITSSNFATVPDAPISSFELKLPTGKFSVLSPNLPAKANFSFCGQKLTMPTKITAQNGAVVKQTTKIAISGCPKAKSKKAAKKAKSKKTKNSK
jgi:hypothetical protein